MNTIIRALQIFADVAPVLVIVYAAAISGRSRK